MESTFLISVTSESGCFFSKYFNPRLATIGLENIKSKIIDTNFDHLFLVKKEKTIKYNSMAMGLKSIGRNLCKYIKITPNIYKKISIKFKL